MKYLKQFCIILLISFIGELLHSWLPLPVPASIYGIVLMFAGLKSGLIPLASVKETGKFLIEIMPVMFIPAAVGLINSWEMISDSVIWYLITAVVTTILVMGAAGRATQAVMRQKRRNEKHE